LQPSVSTLNVFIGVSIIANAMKWIQVFLAKKKL
jgi:hypothetical protein